MKKKKKLITTKVKIKVVSSGKEENEFRKEHNRVYVVLVMSISFE